MIYLNKEKVFTILIYLGLFIFLIYPYTDYDFGWHYRYGEHFINTGQILRQDIYSWTLPGYKWINHSWAYDPLLYLIFNNFSFLGLSIAGATVAFLAFYVSLKPFNLIFWQKAILALTYSLLINGVLWQGLRSQVIGLLMIALLMFILSFYLKNKKWIYFVLPGLFLTWANLHGTFLLGLLIFAIFIFSQFVIQRFIPSKLFWLIISFFVSTGATFINPFTYHIYLEAFRHFNNPLLSLITEWRPVSFPSAFYTIFLVYTTTLGILTLKRKNINDIFYVLVTVLAFYLAISARRYVGVYLVCSLPLAALALKNLNFKLENFKTTDFIFVIATLVIFEIGIFQRLPYFSVLNYNFEDYCFHGSKCSTQLTKFLSNNPPLGRGFNFYDWGGFFIGAGIKAKLFIDGRMHLWEKGGFKVYSEYNQMYYQKDWERFKKYDFDWFVGQRNSEVAQKLRGDKDLGEWEEKYSDEMASYFVRTR